MATIKDYSPKVIVKETHVGKGVATVQGTEFGSQTDTGNGIRRVAHFKYNFSTDGGAVGVITPALNVTLPLHAILLGGILNVTTSCTSGGSATVAIGTSAGSSATSLLAATAVASLGAGLIALVPLFSAATAVKLTAQGNVTLTVATAALTAGVIEGWIEFYVASA